MLMKVLQRLVHLFRFLLSFSRNLRLFPKCCVALHRLGSFWRHSPSHILCSHDPTQPLLRGKVVAQESELSTITPFPSDGDRAHPPDNRHVVIQVGPSTRALSTSISANPHVAILANEQVGRSTESESAWIPKPGVADGRTRYALHKNERKATNVRILAGKESLIHPPPPPGWQRLVHPEGNPFFYHPSLRVFTDTYITVENGLAGDIMTSAINLVEEARKKDLLDDHTEIVLNVSSDAVNGQECHYYFVDHINRRLFWLADVSVKDLFGRRFRGVNRVSQIRYLLEENYWYILLYLPQASSSTCCIQPTTSRSHCQYYPHNRPLPREVFDELRGMLSYAKADITMSDTSLSPFALEELDSLLDIVKSYGVEAPNEYNVCIIARCMLTFARYKFENFHGQDCARLDADAFIFGEYRWEDRLIFKITNVFLFGSLKEHALRSRRVWADYTVVHPRWKDFLIRVTNELSRKQSTVMLTASLAFLAVPNMTRPPQVIIYGSALATISSIIVSFGLLNVYSNPKLTDPMAAAKIMTVIHDKVGIPFLAITHSLPMALLIWSIFLFFIALAYYILAQVELVVHITFGVLYFILLCFGALCCLILYFFAGAD